MLFKMFTSCKIWKNLRCLNKGVSLFFHNIGPNLAQILPPRPHFHFFFLISDEWNVLGDSININLSCTFEKKNDKTSNKKMFCILWAQSPHQKRGHNFFFARKQKHITCTNFLFYQNIICFGWVSYKSFSILSDIFHQKSVISSMHPYIARVMYVWLQHIKKISWKFPAQILNSLLITAIFMEHRKCIHPHV